MDSTILADAVATQDTVTQLVSAIRRVAREVPGAAEQIADEHNERAARRPLSWRRLPAMITMSLCVPRMSSVAVTSSVALLAVRP